MGDPQLGRISNGNSHGPMGDTPMVLRGHHDSEAATNMSPEGEIHPINPWPGDVVLARPDMGKNSESDPVTRGPDMGKNG